MAPIVVPGVARYAVNQRLGGQDVVNIIDMQVDTTGTAFSREEALNSVGGDILNAWTDHILPNQSDDITAVSVSWLDLDSLTGPVGERNETDDETWPQAGLLAGTGVMPAVVALRVDKATAGGRGTKRGRMYIAGMRESDTDEGVSQSWAATILSDWNAGLDSFLDSINDQIGGLLEITRQMVVVHRIGGVSSYTEVTSLTANPNISTQVRRGVLR